MEESDAGVFMSVTLDQRGSIKGGILPSFECYFLSKDINVSQDINKFHECLVKSRFVGLYNREPIENEWHEVEISLVFGSLKWHNKAGVTWSLEIINKELWAKYDCPYGASTIQKINNSGKNISLIFKGEEYRKID